MNCSTERSRVLVIDRKFFPARDDWIYLGVGPYIEPGMGPVMSSSAR